MVFQLFPSDFAKKERELIPELLYFPSITYDDKDYPDLTGKVYIVTGASSGLGLFSARELLLKGATVYLFAKTKSKLDAAIESLIEKDGIAKDRVHGVLIDYADLTSIKPALTVFLEAETRLDGIIHNAGMNNSDVTAKTSQNHRLLFGVNALAPFVVQEFLNNIIIKTAATAPKNSVRIVWVASSAHWLSPNEGGINLDDIENANGAKGSMNDYGTSKTWNIYEAALWAKKHADSGVVSVSVHPGMIGTDIGRNMSSFRQKLFSKVSNPLYKGGFTVLYPFLNPSVTTEDNGSYYKPFGVKGYVRSDIQEGINSEKGEKAYEILKSLAAEYYKPT